MTEALNIRIQRGQNAPEAVERLLRLLPDWFGIEESVLQYIEDAKTKPTYLAVASNTDAIVGALLITRHNPSSAEVHLMLVDPSYHRQGIGRLLVDAAESDLRADGVEVLQVKTQGPSMPDEGYANTTRFYEAMGFIPMEEIIGLWPSNPCLILVKPL
ncbi:MAG TPA: GNAT family N-acetyltransferase [Actinomycetes bacterium]|nr:GNAT family N-acetyltransferase [Actinomycetes bacterium]